MSGVIGLDPVVSDIGLNIQVVIVYNQTGDLVPGGVVPQTEMV